GTILLLEIGPMRRERQPARPGIEHGARDIVPETRLRDLFVEDMVDCLGDRRDRPARIDERAAPLAMQRPASVRAERDILPADLAHAVHGRGLTGGFEIDDTDELRRGHWSTSGGWHD